MSKKDEVEEILKTDAEEGLEEYGQIVSNYVIKTSIIGLLFCYIIAIIVGLFGDNISPLIVIEIGSFKGIFIGYGVFCTIVLLVIIFLNSKKPQFWMIDESKRKSLKRYYDISNIFSLMTFVVESMVIIYLVLMLVITPTNVRGSSMTNTLMQNDKLLVYHLFYTPKRGDIIIVDAENYKGDEEQLYVKRIIAGPNDNIKITCTLINNTYEVNVYVNDELLNEDYIKEAMRPIYGTGEVNITLNENEYYVMGDNRNDSSDSRYFGVVNGDDILGHVVARIYPNPCFFN